MSRVGPGDAPAAVMVLTVFYHLVCTQEACCHGLDAHVVAEVCRAETAKQSYRRVSLPCDYLQH